MENRKRIHLLSSAEIEELYARAKFNAYEQRLYFTLSELEQTALARHTHIKTRVYFILQLGYFKAKRQVFNFSFDDASDDTRFIIDTYYGETESVWHSGHISRDYARKQKQTILALYGYHSWSSDYAPDTESHIGELLRYYPKGHSAFRQLLGYFDQRKIVIPSYTTLQDMFSNAFSAEEKRLNAIILSMPASEKKQLSLLVQRDDGITQLNIIRADQKDFQYTAVRTEVEKALRIGDLYAFSITFIPTLKLSKNAIRYYADIAEQYAASLHTERIRRFSPMRPP